MGNRNGVSPYDGIRFSLKKEGNPATCHNVDELEDMMLSETSQSRRSTFVRFHFMRAPEESDSETGSGRVGARGCGRRDGAFVFHGTGSVWEDGKVLEMGGEGGTAKWMYLRPLDT